MIRKGHGSEKIMRKRSAGRRSSRCRQNGRSARRGNSNPALAQAIAEYLRPADKAVAAFRRHEIFVEIRKRARRGLLVIQSTSFPANVI